jgi:hypothetical protein
MAALRILVPVKRVIDYAVGPPFQFNASFRVRALSSWLRMELDAGMEAGGEGGSRRIEMERRIVMRRVGREGIMGILGKGSGELMLTGNRSDPASTKRRQRSRRQA